MKTTLFVRPNLKIYLLVALTVVVLKECVIPADSSPIRESSRASMASGMVLSVASMEHAITQTLLEPTSYDYALISECYQRQGDFRKAMLFLRKALLAADLEAQEN